ncbi:hypothetical protein BS78_04G031200 [Paspalum vaginatum]|nr:hypothetical protein BS78_04G031200 [Paspalum vaginatum]
MRRKALQNSLEHCSASVQRVVKKRGLLDRAKLPLGVPALRKLVRAAGLGCSAENAVGVNVRGLGDSAKCNVVRDALNSASPSLVCIQETKLRVLDNFKAKTFLPQRLAGSYLVSSSSGSRGGMLTAWDPQLFHPTFHLSSCISRRHTLTTILSATDSEQIISLTNVYAPADHRDSPEFLEDLHELLDHIQGA